MPQLLVKSKEETMEQQNLLMDLEEIFVRLSDGVNAVKLIALGLESVQAPNAGGLYAVWRYLDEAEGDMHKLLNAVSVSGTTA